MPVLLSAHRAIGDAQVGGDRKSLANVPPSAADNVRLVPDAAQTKRQVAGLIDAMIQEMQIEISFDGRDTFSRISYEIAKALLRECFQDIGFHPQCIRPRRPTKAVSTAGKDVHKRKSIFFC